LGSSLRASFGPLLPRRFFARPALEVAPELLGAVLVRGTVALRITEVEAYVGPDDTACHTRVGRTARNETMWGEAGRAYVYLCYGMHHMLNVVTGRGEGAAVLVRAAEVVAGLATVRRRRGALEGPVLTNGPGKLAAALGLGREHDGEVLFERGGLELHRGERPSAILVGPRVGIDYAEPVDRDAPYRFAVAGSRWVSHTRPLRPFERRVSR
jgi:DNA-3-methyladenine glycosylase